jgi:hypothetical protein
MFSKVEWGFITRDYYNPEEVDRWWWKPYNPPKPEINEPKKKQYRKFF